MKRDKVEKSELLARGPLALHSRAQSESGNEEEAKGVEEQPKTWKGGGVQREGSQSGQKGVGLSCGYVRAEGLRSRGHSVGRLKASTRSRKQQGGQLKSESCSEH